jgi:hypothetical protein
LNRNLVGSNALPSAATIAKTDNENGTTLNLNLKKAKRAKTETKNGTTLILNLKKAEIESENGKREIHTTWRFMPVEVYTGWSLNPNRSNLLKAHGRIVRLRSSSRRICATYVSNSYHFHGTVRCPGHPIVDKWRASRAKIQGLYNPDVAFI